VPAPAEEIISGSRGTEIGTVMNTGMNTRAAILGSVLLLTMPLFAREKTDVIVMKNGDRMTCEVKGLDAGVLSVSLDYVDGTISVQWSKVAHLESNQLFVVRTQKGLVYTGKLGTVDTGANQPVQIQIVETDEKTAVVDRVGITRMNQASDKFWQRFNGDINLGITYSKGNQATQYNFGTQTEYLRERWAAQATFNSNLSSNSGSTTSTRNQLNLNSYHLLPWDNYFYGGIGSFLQSSVQGIRLQTNLGGGIGRFLKNTNRMRLTVFGGMAWQDTDYSQSITFPQRTQSIAAALIAAQLKVYKFKKTNLDFTVTTVPALSDPGRLFFNTNASYYVKLFTNLSWNVSFYGNWDTQPPPGLTGSDYGTSSGFKWTFGNR
jgi:hypothetical protein